MKNKSIYREYFPGYMGHIPMKMEVIGLTVGATNDYIKGYLRREPNFDETLVPSVQGDYSNYNKNYFSDIMSKEYKLEEDKVYSNHSKDAKTWIASSKYKIYPQHIPGYKAHVPGIQSANIFGMSYSKSTAVSVKGDYCKSLDYEPKDRYETMTNIFYNKPKVRSEQEGNDYLI
jgi:hypothetical protein